MKFRLFNLKCFWILFHLAILFAPCQEVRCQNGLHGYLASYTSQAPATYGEGYGFYSAIWTLIQDPVANFQVGLPSTWITPDNSDNTTTPLCPVGTIARDNWPERGPTYASVFQTVEGGPGYWVGNKFHYGPPKFKMNSTPNCYNQQISTPGWQFFFSDTPMPDDVLGIAQISNRLLIPPDGLPFQGNPNGDFLGISYMALPLTSSYVGNYPVGEKSWTLFLNAVNFKGPLAFYLPETWAKISENYPFDYGRGLDARAASKNLAGGSMEIAMVPMITRVDNEGNQYYKIPQFQFPVDSLGRTILTCDVTYYSKTALYNDVLDWKNGGDIPSGTFSRRGSYTPSIRTYPVQYQQDGKSIIGINEVATPAVFSGHDFGIAWTGNVTEGMGNFPQYFKDSAGFRVAVRRDQVPESTGLVTENFNTPNPDPSAYHADLQGAWRTPGPVSGPHYVELADHSRVVYFWYRFIDQPVFQQFDWSQARKDSLQQLIEDLHQHWTIDLDYMRPPSNGNLVSFDPALLVTPPEGLEYGYVPIVVRQEKSISTSVFNHRQLQEPFLEMYPNPAQDILHFSILSPAHQSHQVSIYSIEGQLIQQTQLLKANNELDISQIRNGMYLVIYSDGKRIAKRRLIKLN